MHRYYHHYHHYRRMGFFSHAAMLGVGYWLGKSYCFRYQVHHVATQPDTSEILVRVERREHGWGHPWWHRHCHVTQQPATTAESTQKHPTDAEVLKVDGAI